MCGVCGVCSVCVVYSVCCMCDVCGVCSVCVLYVGCSVCGVVSGIVCYVCGMVCVCPPSPSFLLLRRRGLSPVLLLTLPRLEHQAEVGQLTSRAHIMFVL